MIGWQVRTIAFLQQLYITCWRYVNLCRRQVIVPLALQGGRDMILLKNGQWVDASVDAGPHAIWRYDAGRHTVTHLPSPGCTRLIRWPWLSVANPEHDLSEFFEGLRITAGHTLTQENAFMLYAHQRGSLPHGTMTILTRDGTEQVVHTYVETPAPVLQRSSSSEDVNFIR
jgi:hypothetical protein